MAEYLSALWAHWAALMSGLVGLLMGIFLRIGRRMSATIKKWIDIPDWVFICIGLICLFWAGYAAWQDKNLELITLQGRLKSPEFSGHLSTISSGSVNGCPIIVVDGVLTNPVGPPSAAINWKMIVEFPNGQTIIGETPFLSLNDIQSRIRGGKVSLVWKVADYWPTKGASPTPTGGSLYGWFWSIFIGLDLNEAYDKKASIVIEFEDVIANKKHQLRRPFGPKGIHLPPGNVPHKMNTF